MEEYIKKETVLKELDEFEFDTPADDYMSKLLVKAIKPADVVEYSKIDKAIEEIEFLRQHRAKYITENNKICIDSEEVLKILKNLGE